MAGGDVCINGIYYDLDTVNKTAEVSKNQHYGGTEVIIAESFEVAGVTYRVTSILTIDENTTTIDILRSYSPVHTNIYNLEGLHQGSTHHGVNIVRMTDGTTRKVVVK